MFLLNEDELFFNKSELIEKMTKHLTFNERINLCRRLEEGCDLEDAIGYLATGAEILRNWDDFHSEMILLICENLCREYINRLWKRNCDWEEYEECDPEVYSHFTSGARKLTKEEFYDNT